MGESQAKKTLRTGPGASPLRDAANEADRAGATLRVLSGYRTKTALVYSQLRHDILTGHYPPGARIVLDQVASQFGVSKVPVREAVVQLVGEGWLVTKPHVGAIVPELDPVEILETSVIRAALEGAAVRTAVSHVTDEMLTELRQLHASMDAAAAANDPEYPQMNRLFHGQLYQACPYPQLRSMVTSLLERGRRWRIVRFLPTYLPQSQSEHLAVLQALDRRDGDAAERLVRQHVEHAGRLIWEFARTHAKG